MDVRSPLEMAARHEIELMERLAAAEANAQQLTEAARAQAASVRREESDRLSGSIAARRIEAAGDRARLVRGIEEKAAAEVARIRKETSGRISEVREELTAMLLPIRKEGLAQ